MPGLIKIGRTSGPASERAKKLSQSASNLEIRREMNLTDTST